MHTFSIITVCLNAVNTIKKTAQSLVKQNYVDFEWIVVDGGSTDGTIEYLDTLSNITHLISEKDSGIYDAMNKGIKLARGEYCLFLNADDWLVDESVLKNIVPFLKSDLVVGRLSVVNHTKKVDYIHTTDSRSVAKHALFFTSLPHPSTFIKRRLFDKFGVYDEAFIIAGDHDFFARVLRNKVSIQFVPIVVSVFCMGGLSAQMKHSQLLVDELSKLRKKNYSFFDRLWIHLFFSGKQIVKRNFFLKKN